MQSDSSQLTRHQLWRAERSRRQNGIEKVDEEFTRLICVTSLLIGPFYVIRVGDKKRFDVIQLCTTTTTAISRNKVQHLLCRYNETGQRKASRYLPTGEWKWIKKKGRDWKVSSTRLLLLLYHAKTKFVKREFAAGLGTEGANGWDS